MESHFKERRNQDALNVWKKTYETKELIELQIIFLSIFYF